MFLAVSGLMDTCGRLSIAVFSIAVLLSACGSDGSREAWVPATLRSSSVVCAGQRAMVPASGTAARTVSPAGTQVQRTAMSPYVAFQVTVGEVLIYFSFDPSLPSLPSTQEARDLLSYAYVVFDLKQPAGVGGSLELLESSTLLHLADFERFEVRDGQLLWRLVRPSADHYLKWLTVYDTDPSNDPPAGVDCFVGDIGGACTCDFSGPSITATLDGTMVLAP